MNDKKNIDRLFQEKFKDFDISPPDNVWKNIKAQKEANRKRVVIIPLWYRIAGVAAAIAIIFSVSTILLNNSNPEQELIVTDQSLEKTSIPANQITQPIIPTKTSIVENKEINTSDSKAINPLANKNKAPIQVAVKNNIIKNLLPTNKKEGVASNYSTNNQKLKPSNTPISNQKNSNTGDNSYSNRTTETINNSRVAQNIENKGTLENKNLGDDQKESISLPNNTQITNTGIKNEKFKKQKDSTINPTNKKSIFDIIKEKKAIVSNDSQIETSDKKWNVAPNVAPVYYNSFSNGSSIRSEFSDNKKQGEVNLSYGIKVAYNINKKLSIRSGISKVDLAYNTQNIGFGTSSITNGAFSDEIDIDNIKNIIISDFTPQSTRRREFTSQAINSETLFESRNPGILNHSLGYLEIPLELKYDLTNSKLGIHMIGGVSTLFLTEDNVTIEAGSFSSDNIIRDDTVNDISFSGNIGFGIDYKLSDKFVINLEPILKYQFNGFKESAEEFTPYYFGVYTGISFEF